MENKMDEIQEFINGMYYLPEGEKPQNFEQYGDLRIEWGWDEEKPMAVLRALRDKKLKETDWRASVDIQEMSQGWKDYRQALRDLPQNYTPTLSDRGELLGVEWPTEPQ